jgi:PAS domain S-box-containing protein
MSFVLFHVLVVVAVGWGAGKWHAVAVSGVAVATMATVQWCLHRNILPPGWVVLWNSSMRFLVFSIAGWLTAEVARLTRHLSALVEERTAQWKAEAERHKATSTRLTEALERFEQVINNITEVFWLSNVPKNQMAYISPGYERVWGRTCEELYREPRSWATAIHPADRDEVLRRAQTDQAAGSYDVEYRILRPDGAVRWIRDRAFPVRNEQGEVYRIAGLAQDITERKQSREMLQTQAAILENMAEGVVVTDEQGVIVQMNPAGERIWGYDRNEVLGQPVSVLSALPEPEATAVMQEVLAALQVTGSWRGTFQNRRKDGATILCEAVVSRLELQGRLMMVAVEQDVTERVRAQEQLQMQARVLESMAEAVLMVDETGTIVLTNPALDALLGYDGGELAGQPMHVLSGVSLEAHNRTFKADVELIKTGGSAGGDYLARRKDGTLIQVNTRNSGLSVGGRFCLVIVGQDITQRKQREEALRQSEETLRVLLNALPEPALLMDSNGTLLAGNRTFARALAMPEDELLGKNVFAFFPPQLAETRRSMIGQVIRTREQIQFEDTREGRHFMTFASPVLDAAGNVTRVAVLALDITGRKQAETVLRQSEQTYRALVETTGTGYLILDVAGRVLDANAEYVRLSGHKSLQQILGRRVVEWTAPNDRERNAAAVASCLKTGAVRNLEVDYAGPNGLITPIEVNGTVVQTIKGKTVLSLCRDITQRKQAESAVARQEALYRTLFELSPDGILLEDANGNILDVNQALCQSFGYSRAELLHQNVRWFVPPDGQGEVEAHLATLQAGQTLEHEVWNLRKNGERCLMRLNEKPLALPDGRQGILVVTRDITQSKRAELTKETFLFLGAQLSSVKTPVEAARAVYAAADQLWQWDAATLDLYFPERDWVVPVLLCDVIDGQRREVAPCFPEGGPPARLSRIMRKGAELILRQPAEMQSTEFSRFGDTSRLAASLMYVAMRREGQPVGVLSIQSYTPNAYTQEDLRTLQALADYCGGALERIRAEQTLQQREDFNRTILATAMDGFFVLDFAADPGGAIVAVNDAFCRLIGYNREELHQMRMTDLEAEETPEDVAQHKARIMAAGADRFETRHRRKDGLEIQVEISVSKLAISSERVFGFVRDITERKRAERTKEAFLTLGAKLNVARTAVDAAKAIYGTADQLWEWHCGTLDLCSPETGAKSVLDYDIVEGQRREVPGHFEPGEPTPRMQRIMRDGPELILREPLGQPEDDSVMIGDTSRPCRSLMCVPLGRAGQAVGVLSIQSYTPNAYTPGDLRTLEALADHCGGALERIHAEAALRQAHDELEQRVQKRTVDLQAANAALRDVYDQLEQRVQERTAELQAANAALGESEERYRSLVNNLNVGVYRNTLGPHGRFLHANPALARMHGYDSVEEFEKVRVADLYQEAGERKAFMVDLLRQGSVVNHELRLKKKDGTPMYGSVNATVHRGPNGEADWVDGVLEDITERKKAEEALRVSEERYRTLAESSPDAIFILDRDIKVQYVNSTAAALWRRKAEDLIERTQSELFPPEIAKRHATVVQGVFKTGKPVRRDEPLAFPGGEQWMEIRLAPLYGGQGTVTSVMGVYRDITERKRAERQLAEALDLNQKMIAASVIGITAYRASGECVFANEALARAVGGSVSEVQQGNFRRLKSWQESGLLQLVEEALNQGQARSGEVYTATRFGKSVWLGCHVAPFVSNGQPHLLLMALDITERKRAEEALKLQSLVVRNMAEGALLAGPDQTILFANAALETTFGYGPGELIGQPVAVLNAGSAEETARFNAEVMRATGRGGVWLGEYQNRRKDGTLFTSEARVRALDLGGRLHYVSVQQDITERKRAEHLEHQILEISDREQARIGQDIHDGLCQQLVSLAFDANALQRDLAAQNRPEASTALRMADYLDQAITESRQLSRGLFPVRLGEVGLNPALQELADSTSARFKIQCRFAGKRPVAVKHAATATHLYRIAQEAVNNAVKHSRARIVCIRLRAQANQIELSVEDDGAGLSPAKRKKATGLGLHIMDYRARAVGGTFHIGPGPQGGTVVSCCVPRPKS